jgi:hypothetical protein
MLRRSFMKAGVIGAAAAYVPAHNFDEQGLRLKAEIEVKGQRSSVRWACHQKLSDDGSLTLLPTNGLDVSD